VSHLSRFKDAAIEKGLLLFLRPKLERYGDLRHITLNTQEKIFTAEIVLRGEPSPLTISQARYRVEPDGEHSVLVVFDVKVSREWAQNFFEDHLEEVKLKIPDSLRPIFKRLL
jgi:hypothetical protein